MKLFKFNPEFEERNDYVIALTLSKTILILSLFQGKFSFVIDTDTYYEKSMEVLEINIGDMPRNFRRTWYYLAEIRIFKLLVFIDISHELKYHKDRPVSINELLFTPKEFLDGRERVS